MASLKQAFSTTIGKKLITAVTGVLLIGFVLAHLLGNLTLLAPTAGPFNTYAHKLDSLGVLKYVAEIGLIVLFGAHIVNGILLKRSNVKAKGVNYAYGQKTKGGPSHFGPSSRGMIVTGMILLAFLILHIIQFRFGPSIAAGYITDVDGEQARDLHRLVMETFANPVYTGIYIGVMLFLWSHLRHGFWSAFQSLGTLNERTRPTVNHIGVATAFVLAIGFLVLPLILFLRQQVGM
jgi:succinate dehydrogenase / fumarate reductase cytochrome b subunit